MKKALFFFALIAAFGKISAQAPKWVDMMQDPNAIFSETVAEFEAYFQDRPTGKSTGYKAFRRWQWHMQDHLGPEGNQSGWQNVVKELNQYYADHPEATDKRNSTSGSWSVMGPTILPIASGQPAGLGRITAIAFHPTDPNTIYAGAPAGGIWKTTDYGVTWNYFNNGLASLGVSSIVVHPTNPNIIYIGTGDRDAGDSPGLGVWRTTDGGSTWNSWNSGMGNRTVYEIIMHPSNANIMIAATNNNIYRTVNGGSTWTLQFSGHNCKDMAMNPTDPNTMYACGTNYYRSTDNGQNWTQITTGVPTGIQRMALGVSANNPAIVYLFAGDGAGFDGLYRSTNSGLSFTQRSSTPNLFGYGTTGGTGSQAWYDCVMIADPANANHIFTGGVNIWESADGGVNWTIASHWTGSGGVPPVHADQHVMEYSPHTGALFAGHDGGINYTTDGGTSWNEISDGLVISQIYKLGQSQTLKSLVVNGFQDNGTSFTRNSVWTRYLGGDGMECAVDPKDFNVIYGEYYYGIMVRSLDGGASGGTIADNGVNGINESGAWVTPFKLNPINPDTMYLGMANIWRSFNVRTAPASNAVTWTRISNFGGTSTIRDLDVARSNTNVVYVARNGTDKFFRSNNANAGAPTWTNLTASLPVNSTPKDIEVHPTNPNKLWIAINNDIYQSVNAGASWTLFSGTLPNVALNSIVFDRLSPVEAMYVGMDGGVFYRDNTLADWVSFSNGFPQVEVTELEIYYDPECRGEDMLRASTYGRGLWESDLRDPGTLAPQACFTATPLEACLGSVVTFEDKSAYNPTSWSWSISPATFTFVNSTNANSQNPQVTFSAAGTYNITLTATNANGNDVVVRNGYITITGSPSVLPITEDFETMGLCGTASDCGVTVCGLSNGWENLVNGTEDDIDWRINEGSTPSTGTGPTMDANPGTITGNYAYTEASACSGNTAIMLSPCLDLTGAVNPELIFSYHMLGSNMGELHLDVLSAGNWVLDEMTPLSGDQGGAWLARTVSLLPYAGSVIKIRFRGITGGGFASDIALDNMIIRESPSLSAGALTFGGAWVPQRGNLLKWELWQSLKFQDFRVDKQLKSGEFVEVGKIPADAGARYELLDPSPMAGLNIYRLITRDENGKENLAATAEIFNEFGQSNLAAYPNPTAESLNLELISGEKASGMIRLVDLRGVQVMEMPIQVEEGTNHYKLDLQSVSPGIYLLRYREEILRIAVQR
ncbi:MAG: T9SS type A sorting domain-containing protein [Bacteroidia bacterium]|nr:T9SS type A sorting domain-containing protein [Bacteroidia bacterium]